MSKIVKAFYPKNTLVVEDAANKVITRVVSDGMNLKDAIREAIRLANFNQQDIFALLCRLESVGMAHYGDYKNYWVSGWGQGIGEAGTDTNNGTNYYASNNQKTITSEYKPNEDFILFAEIDKLRSLGMTGEDIKSINPELENAVNIMEEIDSVVASVDKEILTKTAETEVEIDSLLKSLIEKAKPIYERLKEAGKNIGIEEIIYKLSGGKFPNIDWAKYTPLIKTYIPDYQPLAAVEPKGMVFDKAQASGESKIVTAQELKDAPVETPAPKEDISVEEAPETESVLDNLPKEDVSVDEAPSEEVSGGSVSAEVTPSPEEIEEMAQQGPEWQIENLLSIEKALNYYEELSKQLESVVFNPNLKLSIEDVAKYDRIRNSIDGEINKINEAQKGKEKLEKKEDKLKEEIEQPSKEISVEEPVAEEIAPTTPIPKEEMTVEE